MIFAILAVRLFGDLLFSCNDPGVVTGREDCFGNFVAAGGILMPRVWDRPDYNFDSLGKVSLVGPSVVDIAGFCMKAMREGC